MEIVPYNDTCISNGTSFNCGCDRAQCPKWKIPAMGHKGIPKRDVIVTIPGSITFADIEWLSLYCRRFKVSFGDITFRTGPTTVAPGNNLIIDHICNSNFLENNIYHILYCMSMSI